MKMERIWQKQRGECNNSKENTVKLGSAAAEQGREIGHRRSECTAGRKTAAAEKGRRMYHMREATEAEGIGKWGVAVAEMEVEGAAEGSQQPVEEATAVGVGMGCHKLSTWNSQPDPWRRR